jgi:hypothetical protein
VEAQRGREGVRDGAHAAQHVVFHLHNKGGEQREEGGLLLRVIDATDLVQRDPHELATQEGDVGRRLGERVVEMERREEVLGASTRRRERDQQSEITSERLNWVSER